MNESDGVAAEKLIAYQFHDSQLLDEALTAAGTANSSDQKRRAEYRQHGNKRLALIRDALIRLIVVDNWFSSGSSTGKYALLVLMHASAERY